MRWIDDTIRGLVDKYGTRDVFELCDCLEIEIRSVEPTNPILKGKKAFYYRYFDESKKEIIFLSFGLEDPFKEFVLMHELGHAVCNTDVLSAGFSSLNIGKYERHANYFALMLSHLEIDELELEGMTIEQIASYLELPIDPLKQITNL